jgi:two-component system KDP operon response regulator KdpE
MTDSDQHVLIIDDEPQIRQFVRAGMELGGYQVLEAANGNDALREVTVNPIDLVILDLALPDIDGSDVLELIRAWSGVPVIIFRYEPAKPKGSYCSSLEPMIMS